MPVSRRDVLKLGGGAAAMWLSGADLRAAVEGERKRIPIGLQLYSVRDDCAKDLPGVLQAVAKMGYQGVEFAGYYERKADELRKMLDDNGLKCCGTHTGLDTITGDALKGTADFNRTLGNKFLIVPSLPEDKLASLAAITETAKQFTELAEKAKKLDMRIGYHAHAGDFKMIEDRSAWDIFFSNAGPEVIMQLDTGNCRTGGGDPVAILKKYPGRSASIHLREYSATPGAVIGEGDVKWAEVLQVCESVGGTEWYIVEHEAHTGAPLDSVQRCLENLRRLQK